MRCCCLRSVASPSSASEIACTGIAVAKSCPLLVCACVSKKKKKKSSQPCDQPNPKKKKKKKKSSRPRDLPNQKNRHPCDLPNQKRKKEKISSLPVDDVARHGQPSCHTDQSWSSDIMGYSAPPLRSTRSQRCDLTIQGDQSIHVSLNRSQAPTACDTVRRSAPSCPYVLATALTFSNLHGPCRTPTKPIRAALSSWLSTRHCHGSAPLQSHDNILTTPSNGSGLLSVHLQQFKLTYWPLPNH